MRLFYSKNLQSVE